MKLARKTETPLHLWSDDLRLFDSKGNLVDAERASELQDRVWELFEDSFGYSTRHAGKIEPSASLYRYVRERIAKLEVSDDDRELLVHLSQLWGNYTGSEVQRQSLKYVWTEVVCGGGKCSSSTVALMNADSSVDEYFVNASLKGILDAVAVVPLAKADVQLGARVVRFVTSDSCEDQQRQVTVETDGELTQSFDEVVVTLPLGVLKRGKEELFDPPLKPALTSAIDAISVGHLEKARPAARVP